MNRMHRTVVFLLAMAVGPVQSAERGQAGLQLELKIEGMFSPEIERAVVADVEKNSAAEKAGIVPGQTVLKIGDCAIPGCKASIAKETMNQPPGETVVLVLQKENGEVYTARLVLQ